MELPWNERKTSVSGLLACVRQSPLTDVAPRQDWTTPDAMTTEPPTQPPEPSQIWADWGRGVADRRSPFRTPTVATIDAQGRPQARTVVLRGADLATRTLTFHTDLRSPKVASLRSRPHLAWHFYDARRKVQLRVQAEATLWTEGPHADAGWERCSDFGKRTYAVLPGPGTPSGTPTSGLPASAAGGQLTPAQRTEARANFAVVRTEVSFIDWLWLHHAGHRRCQLRWTATGWVAGWVVP